MKSLEHGDPLHNPITVNIYGLPDLVPRKDNAAQDSGKTMQSVRGLIHILKM